MSCGIGDCGCGCEELVQLGPKISPPVTEEAGLCGDGSCGCGCRDIVTLKSPREKKEEKEKHTIKDKEELAQEQGD